MPSPSYLRDERIDKLLFLNEKGSENKNCYEMNGQIVISTAVDAIARIQCIMWCFCECYE